MEFNSIFHAFNMRYKRIGELAERLANLGITHIQFPPVQTTRVLSFMDYSLLTHQLDVLAKGLFSFYEQCKKAKEKAILYKGHEFDFFLHQKMVCINQPTLQTMYKYMLYNNVSNKDIYSYTFSRIGEIKSSVVQAFLEILNVGKSHPWYSLVTTADRILDGINPNLVFETFDDGSIQNEYNTLRLQRDAFLKTSVLIPVELDTHFQKVRKHHLQFLTKKKQIEKAQILVDLIQSIQPFLTSLKADDGIGFTTAIPKISDDRRFFQRIFLYELILFPPWWLIYQPTQFSIGDTFLGTRDEIINAIGQCKKAGLEVIVDVVVNNLASTAGERCDWEPIAKNLPEDVKTLADAMILESKSNPRPIQLLKELLRVAFQNEDLHQVLAPFDCREGQEPTQCWMSQALPQVNQDHPQIQNAQTQFIESLAHLGVSGLRIDAAAHISPQHLTRIMASFRYGLSYIEYVGGEESWRKYPATEYERVHRCEDFQIGDFLVTIVFGHLSHIEFTKNYGGERLLRNYSDDSVVMVLNHDQLMESIPSKVISDMVSKVTYELSLAYLLQRIYGSVLLLPHTLTFEYVKQSLELRRLMKQNKIVREYVRIEGALCIIYKMDSLDKCHFISFLNIGSDPIMTMYGEKAPFSFSWNETNPLPVKEIENMTNLLFQSYKNPKKRTTRKKKYMPDTKKTRKVSTSFIRQRNL